MATLLILGTVATSVSVAARGPPSGPQVHALGPSDGGTYLYTVGYRGNAPANENARFHGAEVVSVNEEARFLTVETRDPGWFERKANKDRDVRYVDEDADDVIQAAFTPNDPRFDRQWGFGPSPGIDAVGAWDTTLGSTDVIVAVIDTGIEADHPDLANLLPGYDFYQGDGIPEDNCGHGTHVAGTVGAVTDNGRGVAGTAQVSIMPLKALDDNSGSCYGSFSAVANAITYAADNGADVVTMSLGCEGCYSRAVEDAMAYAASKDVLITAAAGNDYGGAVAYPGASAEAMAVTAIDRNGDSPSFVSTGPEVEIAAPGLSILSTTLNGDYAYGAGTSMATPHVAGVAALVRSVEPMPATQLREHLTSTAVDLGLPAEKQGAGAVNAANALAGLSNPNGAPTASIATDCTDLACTFDASSSSDPDGDALSYDWRLGDGTTATGAVVEHTFPSEGSYDVEVTVTDPDGASDTATKTVTVQVPNGAPTASIATDCTDLTCLLDGSGSSDPDGDTLTFDWDLGDGSTGTGTSLEHTYSAEGTYTVTLTVTDPDGASDQATTTVDTQAPNKAPTADIATDCTDLTCLLDGSSSSDPDGDTLTFDWDLGDGSTGTGTSLEHTYSTEGTYTVTLTVTDPDGASDSASTTVTATAPNQAPTADPAASCTDLTCALDASGSSDPDGDALSYAWDLGDGTTAAGASAEHTYSAEGSYTVTLTVTDPDGASDTATTTVSVQAPNGAPTASIATDCTDLTCLLDGSGSSDPDGDALSFAWDLGDGATATGASLEHAYSTEGTYTVTLTVTDPDGARDTASTTVSLQAPNGAPTASIAAHCTDLECLLDGSSSSDPDGDALTFDWELGDGSTGTGASLEHAYNTEGTYTVTLTVTDPDGATDTTSSTVTATAPNEAPTAAIAADCTDLTCLLDGSGSNDPDGDALSYTWELGDGSTATGASLEHTYSAEGTYTVTLTVTDPDGASDTARTTVEVTDPQQPPEKAMHVLAIHQYASGDSPHVTVWIYDAENRPVEDAAIRVPVCKAGGDCETFTGYTSSRGALSFSWPDQGHGTYYTCVTKVKKAGWTWDTSANNAPDGGGRCLFSDL